MVTKPGHVFDRDWEWEGLTEFAAHHGRGPSGPRATLGVVSGRRRQGKSYLLQALAQTTGGLYFGAQEATEAVALRNLESALARHSGTAVDPPFRDWGDAIAYLFRSHRDRPVPVVLDEFPFLARVSPEISSIIQRELGPGGSGEGSGVRLILCGSAMSVMGRLLAGQAPLRGRAGLELVVKPFGFRDAATFWDIADPRLAVLVHSVVGGTPAYRYEFTAGDPPEDLAGFDEWVLRTALNSRSALFREARYLLAEEPDIREPALYHSVLAAIAAGRTTSTAIATFIGRKADHIKHPLNVLEDCALVTRQLDLFRPTRAYYRVVEPLITFYEAIMQRNWTALEARDAPAVWQAERHTFQAKVLGPHFESLCRDFAREASVSVFGGLATEVGAGVVNDPERRTQIEIDVAILGVQDPDGPRRVLSLGEAKWGERMGVDHVRRLGRARDLLGAKGYDVRDARLACYSGVGFDDGLREAAAEDDRIVLIDLDRLYQAPTA
ncbi:MAG: ATP-binding protein [Streptosporangiales bacterium]|nr:ATP-binding protein [Streptosporangiales bacterium]